MENESSSIPIPRNTNVYGHLSDLIALSPHHGSPFFDAQSTTNVNTRPTFSESTGPFVDMAQLSPINPIENSMEFDLNIVKMEEDFDIFDDLQLDMNFQASNASEDLFDFSLNNIPLKDEPVACLDPKYKVPAAMTAVRPDDVMPLGPFTPTSSFASDPVAMESKTRLLLPQSYPPRNNVWRDTTFISANPTNDGSDTGFVSVQNSAFSTQIQNESPESCHDQQTSAVYSSLLQEHLLRSPSASYSTPSSIQDATSPINVPTQLPKNKLLAFSPRYLSEPSSDSLDRLSTSAPVYSVWERREPSHHLLSTSSLLEELGGSSSSIGESVMSPIPKDHSLDEGIDTEEESDESDSDDESLHGEDALSSSLKKDRHFWQYNIQAKGPKGHKVNITKLDSDPHNLSEIMDPVFSPLCSVDKIKHSGKARRGDGNDLTPNPKKLVSIGRELDKLNKRINDLPPVSELPVNARPNSRKEKNKLASRVCRLKKKAQHEANKIKLHGLQEEYRDLKSSVSDARSALLKKIQIRNADTAFSPDAQSGASYGQSQLTYHIEKISKSHSRAKIAGHTADFVNRVIDSCESGRSEIELGELLISFEKTKLATSPP